MLDIAIPEERISKILTSRALIPFYFKSSTMTQSNSNAPDDSPNLVNADSGSVEGDDYDADQYDYPLLLPAGMKGGGGGWNVLNFGLISLKMTLDFLWEGGFRSLIVAGVAGGAIWITFNSPKLCPGMPDRALLEVPSQTPPQAPPPADGSGNGGKTSFNELVSLVQPNPICSKFFELAFMVVGGYLGLSSANYGKFKGSKPRKPSSSGQLSSQRGSSDSSFEHPESNKVKSDEPNEAELPGDMASLREQGVSAPASPD